MAKAKQRFAWRREASNGTAIKVDQSTDETLRIDGMEFPQAIREEIFVYGISKIIDDRLSQVAPDAKMSEARTLVAQLISGEWKAERVGGARQLAAIIIVIMNELGCSVHQAQAAWRKQDDAEKAALREALAEKVQQVEEARKTADEVSLDGLLASS